MDFVGYIDEVEKLHRLRSAWVLAYPSPKEGWGITVVEASACGTPVIASDSPGLRESVRAGESGLLVPHGIVELWVQAFEKVLSDPDLRGRMGTEGQWRLVKDAHLRLGLIRRSV